MAHGAEQERALDRFKAGRSAGWRQKAGYIRNKQMLDEGKPDLVIAFPGGKGTAMMIDLATKAGVKVIDMGTKGLSHAMIMIYNKANLKIMLGEAILSGDKKRYDAITNALAEEYEEIIKGQEIIDGIDSTSPKAT